MKNVFKNITLIIAGLIIGSCQKELPNQPKPNQSPSTRLWIASDSLLNETVSRQHVYFYGEDPDGYVTGYLISFIRDSAGTFKQIPQPDPLTYVWTTRNDTILALPLLEGHGKFTVIVRAVDNTFPASSIPNNAIVKGFPNPYWDKDSNGIFSAGDVYLNALQKAVDPKGAIQLFPIVNTKPTIQFAVTADDNQILIEQPETTYTAATFVFVGSDDDGNQTLKSYRIALNDTLNQANWFELQSSASTRTLKATEADTVKMTLYVKRADSDIAGATTDAEVYTGSFGNLIYKGKIKNLKLNSENVLYIKSKDVAGDSSSTKRMPSVPSKRWYVKKPQSRMLVVADYAQNSSKPWIVNYYRDMFSKNVQGYNQKPVPILNGNLKNFDVFSFDRALSINYTYFSNPAFIKTLQLYDVVLWFTDVSPNINAAQIGLFYYANTFNEERNTYGHVIFTTVYQNNPTYEDLRKFNDFAPLDSTSSESIYGNNRLPVKDQTTNINTQIVPMDSTISTQGFMYPILYSDSVTTGGSVLTSTGQHTAFYKKLYKRTDSHYIYKLDSSRTNPPSYKGQLEIGIIDNQKRFVMFGLPLHLLNGLKFNLPLFFQKVIEGEFGLN